MQRAKTKRHDGEAGVTLIELLIVVAIILTIAAMAIPNFLRARLAANESSTVAALRSINSAAATYESTFRNGYPGTLAQLNGPGGVPPTCDSAQLIDSVTAAAAVGTSKSGYLFTYPDGGGVAPLPIGNPPAGCTAGVQSYGVEANPALTGTTGQRCFFSDNSGVIRFDGGGAGACADGALNRAL